MRVFTNRVARLVLTAVILASISGGRGIAQSVKNNGPSAVNVTLASVSSTKESQAKSNPADDEKTSASEVNSDRKKLLADIHTLLILSQQLKAETAKSTPNMLSLGMVKKAEEIQKLAAVVKTEMAKVQ